MKLVQTAKPTNKPVSLDEAKTHLRVLHDEEDALIDMLISAATDKAEQITNRQLAQATYELYGDTVPSSVELPKPPLVEVVSVQAMKDGIYTDIDYTLDDKADPAVLYIDDTSSDDEKNTFRVSYKAGYTQCPPAIKQWILVQIATMYEQRESYSEKNVVNMPRTFVDNLLDSYRVRIV